MVTVRTWRRMAVAAALAAPLTVGLASGASAAGTPSPTPTPTDGYAPPPESSVALAVKSPECDGNVPYLRYGVDVSKDPSARSVDITWTSLDGTHSETQKNLPVSGRVLWLGAAEAGGQPTAWPGWVFKNGTWEEGGPYTWVRPDVKVTFTVHDDEYTKTSTSSHLTVSDGVYRSTTGAPAQASALVLPAANIVSSTVSYPPATKACANPAKTVVHPGGGTSTDASGGSLAETGAAIAPFAAAAAALLAIGGGLVIAGRRRSRLPH